MKVTDRHTDQYNNDNIRKVKYKQNCNIINMSTYCVVGPTICPAVSANESYHL